MSINNKRKVIRTSNCVENQYPLLGIPPQYICVIHLNQNSPQMNDWCVAANCHFIADGTVRSQIYKLKNNLTEAAYCHICSVYKITTLYYRKRNAIKYNLLFVCARYYYQHFVIILYESNDIFRVPYSFV